MDDVLYLYFDEAGDFNFKPNGTRHFIMTCVAMRRPFGAAVDLLHKRYDLIEEGAMQGYFHASEDRNAVRAEMFKVIKRHLDGMTAYAVAVEKDLGGGQVAAKDVYASVFGWLVGHVVAEEKVEGEGLVVAITDDIPTAARKGEIKGRLKRALKESLPEGARFRLIHQRSEGDLNLQIADYFCWSLFRLREKGDDGPYSLLMSSWGEVGSIDAKKMTPQPIA